MDWNEMLATLTDENLESHLANEYADVLSFEWYNYQRCMHTLPVVCDAGKECRAQIRLEAQVKLTTEWHNAFDRIREIISDSWFTEKQILVEGYEEEFACDPQCYCEEIENSYIDHVRLEREIEREIRDEQEEIKKLIQKQNEVLENCPDYEETMYVVDEQYLV